MTINTKPVCIRHAEDARRHTCSGGNASLTARRPLGTNADKAHLTNAASLVHCWAPMKVVNARGRRAYREEAATVPGLAHAAMGTNLRKGATDKARRDEAITMEQGVAP